MRSDEVGFDRVEVDGERLLLPSADARARLRRDPFLDGRPVGVGNMIDRYVDLAERVPGLRLALADTGEAGSPFVLLHLVQIEGRWKRVVVEGHRCPACPWTGLVGVHRDLDLYIGTRDPMAALRANWNLPLEGCPRCGAALERAPCWVMDDEDSPPDEAWP